MRGGWAAAECSRRTPSACLTVLDASLVYTGRVIMDQILRPQSVRFFDEAAVQRALPLEALLPAMERALIDFSGGRVLQPVRSIISIREHSGFMGLMPAVYGDIMGAKLVNFYPNNGARGLPTHLAIIALFRSETGEPLAIMDGRLITELRTAAVSAIATRLLSALDARRLAILGSGVQARAHIRALSLVRKFDKIRIWSRNPQNAKLLADEVGGVATSAEEAVRDADVVVTVTASSEPVLRGKWLKPGVMINAVGAVGSKRRELDDDAMRGAFVVDSREAALVESGDMLLAGASIYAELGELLAGTKLKPEAEITVFKSLGLAVEDLAAAKLVLDANPI
jgi:ornithine cyclodeaminase/alanine dehydrogenase-like protein (mu-crystallin family)